ncbi:MAG TPA: T9SS type A sorting domain-containing protein [Bacteroidia bacterium]|jgi:hypothetical protein|nr:T9SS type A sorting domain-containing protein [Bacteroidia bacterium]
MKKQIMMIGLSLSICIGVKAQSPGQKKILWDCSHSETAGNGDWCIDADVWNLAWNPNACVGCGSKSDPQRYPTPAQTTVVSTTTETYWTGALSAWAIDCVKRGYWVETLPPATGQITYGNTSNPQDLSNYDVFIVDEPNIIFNSAEKTALVNFIANGGSLFAISDHTGSDRNNDGWDSPAIWNDFLTNNGTANNAFGYKFMLENFSGISTNIATAATDSIIHGPFGNVAEVQWSNGTSMDINPSQNPSVKAHVWKAGLGQTDTAVLCVTARYGCGKIASIGDSSPPDDGTGNPGVTLYTGYTGDAAGNHRPWLMNLTIWLVEGGNCVTTSANAMAEKSSLIVVYPNPFTDYITVLTGSSTEKTEVNIYDQLGKKVLDTYVFNNGETKINLSGLSKGVYFVTIKCGNTFCTRKLVK